jgi:FtsP/CotA-like multicopper oxidase with cupredoxin domain
VAAFAEGDGAPSIPGPLLRVRAGTRVRVTVRNALDGPLAGRTLIVHGLYRRPAEQGDTLRVEPGASREVGFEVGVPGTYYYWATVADSATTADLREGSDAALSGALIVDPAEGPVPADRIFVITMMDLQEEGVGETRQPFRFSATINGLSWPHTERFDFAVGDTVRWRWINPSYDHHPMHLHGFYFQVDALGDESSDTLFAQADRKLVVTQRLPINGTMAMTWVPERPGNWLFHCHLQGHSGPNPDWGFPDVPGTGAFGSALAPPLKAPGRMDAGAHTPREAHDMERDMAGLILGIRVRPSEGPVARRSGGAASAHSLPEPVRREVRLTLLPHGTPDGAHPVLAARVEDVGAASGRASAQSAGIAPPIVLRQDEPARITVVNTLDEPTALHWHGMELESYYDGVPGWTGGVGGGDARGRLSPELAPRDSFAALMTPPRAGTFIYHSHALTTTQVGDGLYGALIVLAPGERYDPAQEVMWIIGGPLRGEGENAFLYLNGERAPAPLTLVAGRRYRVRLINITENNTADVAFLSGESPDTSPVVWRPLAKDAAPLPATHTTPRPARLRTSVGETYDFEFIPSQQGVLLLEVRNGGDLMVQQRVMVR